jgi:hypothetical protein
LHQMILEKITRSTAFVIICAPILYCKSFSSCNRNSRNPISIPVIPLRKSIIKELANKVFPQVMINTVYLMFIKMFL